MELRTTTGKILLALAGTVGVALVVFVVVPWLQAPAPPVSPVSSDEIIQEVMGPPGENGGEVIGRSGRGSRGATGKARKPCRRRRGLLRNR